MPPLYESPGFPLTTANPGWPQELKAYDWQAVTSAVKNGQRPPPLPPIPQTDYNAAPQYILVRNDSPADHWLWSGSAFALGDCLTPHYHYAGHSPGGTTPADSLAHDWLALFSGIQQAPAEPGQWAVAVDSIAPGEIGRAVFHGLAWVIWHQAYGDWTGNPTGRDLDYGPYNANIGYTVRGFPGRGRILWAPPWTGGGYVLGLAYFGNQPPYTGELASYNATTQGIPTPAAGGAFDLVLNPFANLTTNTTAGAWIRQAETVAKITRPGAWRLDYQAIITPAVLDNPWPDNSPAKTLAHTWRLFVEKSTSPTFASGNAVAGAGLVDRFTVYPAAGITAEGFTFAAFETAPLYVRLRLTGNLAGSPTGYGAVARSQFAARWAGPVATSEQNTVWNTW